MAHMSVIKTGGKQYLVSAGDVISIEKIVGDPAPGSKVVFDEVLLADDGVKTVVGTPTVPGAAAIGEVLAAERGKKIEVVKYKAKSRYFKLRGHRQPYCTVRIEKVT